MGKCELTNFKRRYLWFLKRNNENCGLCKWLEDSIDFEKPDGFYYDDSRKLLVIFEHFEIDCSERIRKRDKIHGSILRKNYSDVIKEIRKEIELCSNDKYESVKVIEQGYCTQCGNNKIYYMRQDGDKYCDNFINNFLEAFESHVQQIEEYKKHIMEELQVQPKETKMVFLVEDKTIFGTYFANDKNFRGDTVILTDSLQCQEMIDSSNVDYVIYGRHQDKSAYIGCKGESKSSKIDLKGKRFHIIPLAPVITVMERFFPK